MTGAASIPQRRCERSSPSFDATRLAPLHVWVAVANSNAEPGVPTFDPDRIVETFARHRVDYLLVGGLAARQYGATRPTGDLDCLARFERENLTRLATAMRELNARLRAEGLSDAESIQLTSHLPSAEFFGRGEITTWMTDAGPLDILHDMPDRDGARLSYDELNTRATTHVYAGGVTIRVAALADIVASKQWANRPKDHRALPELEALQRFAVVDRGCERNSPGRDLSP